jgi:predicted nucleic acid-binding protein
MTTDAPAWMVVIDASVWVSRLVSQDVHHDASRRWLEEYTEHGGRIITPALLLPEVAGAISRRTGESKLANQVVKQLQRLPLLQLVSVDQRLGQAAARLAANLGLRGADAVYVAVAEQLTVPLLTWDKEQIDKAGKLVQAVTPDSPPSKVFQ